MDSLRNLSSKLKDVEANVRQVEDLAASHYHSITEMSDPAILPYLAERASHFTVQIQCKLKGNPSTSIATGFIVDSSNGSLIMTSTSFLRYFEDEPNNPTKMLERNTEITVYFFDKDEGEAKLVHVDLLRDIVLLRVENISGKSCVEFSYNVSDPNQLRCTDIHTVFHKRVDGVLLSYQFAVGTISHQCSAVPQGLVDSKCECYLYTCRQLGETVESCGAPIMNIGGEVVAMHSSRSGDFCIGIGLKSIEQALLNYSDIHSRSK